MRLKKLERRGVHFAISADGRDQCNRSRHDEAGEKRVSAVGKFIFEIKFHEKEDKAPSSNIQVLMKQRASKVGRTIKIGSTIFSAVRRGNFVECGNETEKAP